MPLLHVLIRKVGKWKMIALNHIQIVRRTRFLKTLLAAKLHSTLIRTRNAGQLRTSCGKGRIWRHYKRSLSLSVAQLLRYSLIPFFSLSPSPSLSHTPSRLPRNFRHWSHATTSKRLSTDGREDKEKSDKGERKREWENIGVVAQLRERERL